MQVTVGNLEIRDGQENILTSVHFYDEEREPHRSCKVTVFVPASDSINELKAAAISQAREFLTEALAASGAAS